MCADCRKEQVMDAIDTWLREAIELHPFDAEKAIDIIYDNLNKVLTAGQFSEIEELLPHWTRQANALPTDILLAILTMTAHAPLNSLSNRRALVDATRTVLKARGEFDHDILKGLE